MNELPIIQKTYDLIKWYIPHINRLPKSYKFTIGDRIAQGLYNFLEALIRARFATNRLEMLQAVNTELDILRYQTRLLFDFDVLPLRQYEFASRAITDIGQDLGGWIKQQAKVQPS